MKNKILLWFLIHGINFLLFFVFFWALSNWWVALLTAAGLTGAQYLIGKELKKIKIESNEEE